MNKLLNLIERISDTLAKRYWLKSISKEINKYERYQSKADIHGYTAHRLKEEYDKIYGENRYES